METDSSTIYYVYIIYSQDADKYYKGYTQDPNTRLVQHNNGESRYTSQFRPWILVYLEQFFSKREALIREKGLKKYSKEQVLRLITSPKNEISSFG